MNIALRNTTDGFERWRADLQSVCGPFGASPPISRALFIGTAEATRIGPLEVAHIHTNAAGIYRERANADRGEDRFCFLILQRSGTQRIRQGDQILRLEPGDFVLVDSALPLEIVPEGLVDNLSIHLRRELVTDRLGSGPAFGRLRRTGLAVRLLRSLVEPITHPSAEHAKPSEGVALEEALVSLLPPALEMVDTLDLNDIDDDPGAVIKALIDQCLDDTTLTPQKLADNLGMSVRRLYRMFEAKGDGVCRYIQRARLERIAQALIDPVHAGESITQLAFRWGFNDAAHFSRAFKRHFGCSPRHYRMQGRAEAGFMHTRSAAPDSIRLIR